MHQNDLCTSFTTLFIFYFSLPARAEESSPDVLTPEDQRRAVVVQLWCRKPVTPLDALIPLLTLPLPPLFYISRPSASPLARMQQRHIAGCATLHAHAPPAPTAGGNDVRSLLSLPDTVWTHVSCMGQFCTKQHIYNMYTYIYIYRFTFQEHLHSKKLHCCDVVKNAYRLNPKYAPKNAL